MTWHSAALQTLQTPQGRAILSIFCWGLDQYSWSRGMLKLGDGGKAIPERYAAQGMSSDTFCFLTDKENTSLACPGAGRNQGFSPKHAGALSYWKRMIILWHMPELWGPIVYFSTFLSVQNTIYFCWFITVVRHFSLYFTDKDLLENVARLGNWFIL